MPTRKPESPRPSRPGPPPSPWWDDARRGWYATVDGRRVRLADDHDDYPAALAELRRLLGDERKAVGRDHQGKLRLNALIAAYHRDGAGERDPIAAEAEREALRSLSALFGGRMAAGLGDGLVREWTALARPTAAEAAALARAVDRLGAWGRGRGLIP